jgi:hypothetical protein
VVSEITDSFASREVRLTIEIHGSAGSLPADEPMLKKDNLLSAEQLSQWDATEDTRRRIDALLPSPICLGVWPVVGDVGQFIVGQVAVFVMAIMCLIIWILIEFWRNIVETIEQLQ